MTNLAEFHRTYNDIASVLEITPLKLFRPETTHKSTQKHEISRKTVHIVFLLKNNSPVADLQKAHYFKIWIKHTSLGCNCSRDDYLGCSKATPYRC